MPLYTFAHGTHTTERLAPLGTETVTCACGSEARRVFGMGVSIGKRHASETVLPASVRAAIGEATGYKREAIAAKQEAEANGFSTRF